MIRARPVFDRLAALADPTRGRILIVLDRHELTVGELCSVLQLPQSTVSRHLKTLVGEGWLTVRADGASRRYSMPGSALETGLRRLWHVVRDQASATPGAAQDLARAERVVQDRRTASQAFFTTRAGQWDRVRGELYGDRPDLGALPALLDPGWIVGDLGCGTGQVAAALAPFVQRVIAVDESSAMLAAARRRLGAHHNVELRAGRIEDLPLDDGVLDAAVLSLVLHFVADPCAVLVDVARVLRPGARLLVIDMRPHDREELRTQMGHVWLGFDDAQLDAWFQCAGLTETRVVPLPPAATARGPLLFAASAIRS